MHALVKYPEKGLVLETVPLPTLGTTDVLLKINKTAICGTDVHIYQWDAWAQRTIPTPMVIGHEFSAEIVETGTAVTHLKVGMRVSGEGHLPCWTCKTCCANLAHLCPQTKGVGVHRQGAFAEYLAIPSKNVVPLPEYVTDDIGALLDPFGNAVETIMACPVAEKDVLITGAGPIGLMAILILKHLGAHSVSITDVHPYRLNMARTFGADCVIDVREAPVEAQLEGTSFGLGLEMSGAASAYQSLCNLITPGGHISLLGIPPADTQIHWDDVIFKGLTLKGIYGREIFATWETMFDMLAKGLDITPIITHRLPFQSFETGFAAACAAEAGKVILDWS